MMRENCKPQMQSYVMMFEMVKIRHPDAKPADCVFLDDAKVNLKTAKEFGFKTGFFFFLYWCLLANFLIDHFFENKKFWCVASMTICLNIARHTLILLWMMFDQPKR